MYKKILPFVLAIALTGFTQITAASVVVGATRIVFKESESEVAVRMTNEGAKPALVEVWLDDGDPALTPDKAKTPFTVSPPIFRIEAKSGQTIRLLYSKAQLPEDRESLFWINVLEVPPVPKAGETETGNFLQFAFRSRMKVFFRPKSLTGNALRAPEQLRWKRKVLDGQCILHSMNPTPFHVTLTELDIRNVNDTFTLEGKMLAPFSELSFPVKDKKYCEATKIQINYAIINDFGGLVRHTGSVD